MTAAKKARLEALEDEAPKSAPELELVEVKFRDQVFTVPKDMDRWMTRTCLAWSRAVESSKLADWVEVVERLLGPEQLQALAPDGDLERKDMTDFLNVLVDTVNTECVS